MNSIWAHLPVKAGDKLYAGQKPLSFHVILKDFGAVCYILVSFEALFWLTIWLYSGLFYDNDLIMDYYYDYSLH